MTCVWIFYSSCVLISLEYGELWRTQWLGLGSFFKNFYFIFYFLGSLYLNYRTEGSFSRVRKGQSRLGRQCYIEIQTHITMTVLI